MKTKSLPFENIFISTICILFLFLNLPFPVYSSQQVSPGGTLIFKKELFASDTLLSIHARVPLNTTNFSIHAIGYGTGADLVDTVYINNSTEDVRIKLKNTPNLAAPEKPNFSVKSLILRANRTIKDYDNSILLKEGQKYTYHSVPSEYIIGHQPEVSYIDGNEQYIALADGENRLVMFSSTVGSISTRITVNYGGIASGTMTVYDKNKGYINYSSHVDQAFSSLNRDAEITAINMGNEMLPARMDLTINAPMDSYIYEVKDGSIKRVSPPVISWNQTLKAWYMPGLHYGKNLLISSLPLYTSSEFTGDSGITYTPVDSEYWLNKSDDTRVKNPMTGGDPNFVKEDTTIRNNMTLYIILGICIAINISAVLILRRFLETKK